MAKAEDSVPGLFFEHPPGAWLRVEAPGRAGVQVASTKIIIFPKGRAFHNQYGSLGAVVDAAVDLLVQKK